MKMDQDELKNYRGMKICSTCYDLYGFFDYGGKCFYQKSDCQPHKDDPKWSYKPDFNEAITLCYCCGQEVLSSGSKFSVWFCRDCQELLKEFKSLYRVVIPIGRHSIMAGIVLKGEDIQNQDAVTQFCNSFNTLFNRIDVLDSWRTWIMQENFKILSLKDDVLLLDYLSARDYLPIKDRAVKGLVEFFIAWKKKVANKSNLI
jgi:hypothetical protein